MKTMILGSGGMLGTDLRATFPDAVAPSHRELDITDKDAVIRTIRDHEPDVVINAAAYTNVDGCEDNQELAYRVNGVGPLNIAYGCSKARATLVHFSSDYVFDGSQREYVEKDKPNPLSVYGKSKLAGERNVQFNMQDYRIIRTSWLFGLHGKNFVEAMLAASTKRAEVLVVNDQIGKPTYTADLAAKTREVISMPPGIYHITNEGICSWYEFAAAIIPNAKPCTTEEYQRIDPRKAKRPQYSVLTNTKTTPMRHWKEALSEYLKKRGYVR